MILNGGFELYNYNAATNTYTFFNWTFGGSFFFPPGAAAGPHSGNSDMASTTGHFGPIGTASQTFSTEAGLHYTLDFYLVPTFSSHNSFSVLWNGQVVTSASNVPAVPGFNPSGPGDYRHYTFDVVGAPGSSQVVFALSTDYYWFLDDVSVRPAYVPGVELRSGTITFSDPDLPDTHNVTVTPLGSNYVGTFTYTLNDSTGSGAGKVNWNVTANDSDLQFLAANQALTQTYQVTISDGPSAISQNVTATLHGVNDAPVLATAAPTLPTVAADATNPVGTTVADLLGTTVTDVDTGAVEGIAITGAATIGGNWQFSIDSGAHWTNFASYSATSALLLAPTDLVRFVPTSHAGGTETFSYVAWDQTSGTHGTTANTSPAGGTTAFSTEANTASLSVTPVNDAPIIVSSTQDGQGGSANLVTNSGFETGNFNGWAQSGDTSFTSVNSGQAHGGTFKAEFGPTATCFLSQNLATVAGQHYRVDFWLASTTGTPDDFSVSWNGTTITSLQNVSGQLFSEYTFDVVGIPGTSSLQFSFSNPPAFWRLDDISVTPAKPPGADASGTVSFTDINPGDTHLASFTNGGAGYVGTFSLDPVTEANGSGSVGWHLTLSNADLQSLPPGPTTQTYTITIDDQHGGLTSIDVAAIIPANDVPTIWAPAAFRYFSAGNSTAINVLSFVDTDTVHNETVTLSVPSATADGTFSFIDDPNVTETLSAGGRILTLVGTVDAINADLAANHITFNAVNASDHIVTIAINDGAGGTASQTMTVGHYNPAATSGNNTDNFPLNNAFNVHNTSLNTQGGNDTVVTSCESFERDRHDL